MSRPGTTTTESLLYPTAEAAPKIHPELSPRTLERWRHEGKGPSYVVVGRRVGYTEKALREFVEASTKRVEDR